MQRASAGPWTRSPSNISGLPVAVLDQRLKLPTTNCVSDGAHQAFAVFHGVVLPYTSAAHRWFYMLRMASGIRGRTPVPSQKQADEASGTLCVDRQPLVPRRRE